MEENISMGKRMSKKLLLIGAQEKQGAVAQAKTLITVS